MPGEQEAKVPEVEPKVIGKVEIFMLNGGGVSVVGPVGNPVLMMEIFGKAMAACVAHIAKEASGRIVVPPNPGLVKV